MICHYPTSSTEILYPVYQVPRVDHPFPLILAHSLSIVHVHFVQHQNHSDVSEENSRVCWLTYHCNSVTRSQAKYS